MPAKSKSQQHLFGMVRAYQEGNMKHAPAKIKEVANHISPQDAHDFAATNTKKLPKYVKKSSCTCGTCSECKPMKHDDTAEDKALIAKLVKPEALKENIKEAFVRGFLDAALITKQAFDINQLINENPKAALGIAGGLGGAGIGALAGGEKHRGKGALAGGLAGAGLGALAGSQDSVQNMLYRHLPYSNHHLTLKDINDIFPGFTSGKPDDTFTDATHGEPGGTKGNDPAKSMLSSNIVGYRPPTEPEPETDVLRLQNQINSTNDEEQKSYLQDQLKDLTKQFPKPDVLRLQNQINSTNDEEDKSYLQDQLKNLTKKSFDINQLINENPKAALGIAGGLGGAGIGALAGGEKHRGKGALAGGLAGAGLGALAGSQDSVRDMLARYLPYARATGEQFGPDPAPVLQSGSASEPVQPAPTESAWRTMARHPKRSALISGAFAGGLSKYEQGRHPVPKHLTRNDPIDFDYDAKTRTFTQHTPTFSEKLKGMFARSKPNPFNNSERTSSGFERLFNVSQGTPGTRMSQLERFMKSPLTHPGTHGAATTAAVLGITKLINSGMLDENRANEILERQLAQNPVQ